MLFFKIENNKMLDGYYLSCTFLCMWSPACVHVCLGVVWGFECNKCVRVWVKYVLLSAVDERKLCKEQFPQGSTLIGLIYELDTYKFYTNLLVLLFVETTINFPLLIRVETEIYILFFPPVRKGTKRKMRP